AAMREKADGELAAIRARADGQAHTVRVSGEAEAVSLRAVGAAKAEAYRLGIQALGTSEYTAVQLAGLLGEHKVKLVPEIAVSGEGGGARLAGGLGGGLRAGRRPASSEPQKWVRQHGGNGGAFRAPPSFFGQSARSGSQVGALPARIGQERVACPRQHH